MAERRDNLLIIGSGPNAPEARGYPADVFDHLLAINNAWAVRPDWDELIHPEDFDPARRPDRIESWQRIVTAQDYVPAQNGYGGFVYAGGTMAFTAGYWALHAHKPRVMAFIGCDMVYPSSGNTHFYGSGAADPLRDDPSLRSLEAKSARLMILAAMEGCACVNLSTQDSRLIFPRADPGALDDIALPDWDRALAEAALAHEDRLGYVVPSGRYWEEIARFDVDALDEIDALWLRAAAR